MSVHACSPNRVAKTCYKGAKKAARVVKPTTGVYAQVLNITRAFAEMSSAFAPAAKSFNKACAPAHIGTLLLAPFEAFQLGVNTATAIKAPSYLKLFPALKMGANAGNILDVFGTGIWIAEQMGASSIQALSMASLGIGGAAVGLQALGIAISLWSIHGINKQWNAVEKALGSDEKKNYKAALQVLTETPASKKKQWRQKFFGVLTGKQKELVKNILQKYEAKGLSDKEMDVAIKTLKKHHISQKRQHWISIALLSIAIVGMALIAFGPVAATPIAWGALGVVGVSSLALLVYSISVQRKFNKSLKAMAAPIPKTLD